MITVTADSKTSSVNIEGTGEETFIEMAAVIQAVSASVFKELPERIAMRLLVDLCTSAIKSGLKSARGEKEGADD